MCDHTWKNKIWNNNIQIKIGVKLKKDDYKLVKVVWTCTKKMTKNQLR